MSAEDFTRGHIKYYMFVLFISLVIIYGGATNVNGITGVKDPMIPVIVIGIIMGVLACLGV